MESKVVTIGTVSGLHSRPASLFVTAATQSGSQVTLARGDRAVNAASMLSVLSLGVQHGDRVELSVAGGDEQATLQRLAVLLSSDLDTA